MTEATQHELLCPAGDWEALRAAVANGADAVYFGVGGFNARYRATNFTLDELPEVMAYLHGRNVRGYAAFNVLIFSDELPEAVKFVTAMAEAGVDALIVQDLGLVRLIRKLCPGLAVHGSTQMTLTEPRGIEFVRELGVERVILARELSTKDIAAIRQRTTMPLEVFVHGALCVAYSGQCLTSESLGGRSANRGQCAQACRLPYELIVDGEKRELGDVAYLLSPQDLAAHDLLGDLVKLGVHSFKIEGRLKSAHYVAATTQTYRAALDAAMSGEKFAIEPQQAHDLAQSFSRGFTHGFFDGVDHQELVHGRFPKSRGVRLGTVEALTDEGVILHTDPGAFVKAGDGIVFDEGHPEQWEQGGRVSEVRRGRQGNRFELFFRHGDLNLAAISIDSIVWKTDDPATRKRLEQSFSRDVVVSRVPLTVHVRAIVGQKLVATFRDEVGREVTVDWDRTLEPAQKYALDLNALREQFGRMGDTPFELGEVTLDSPQAVMVPRSVLNDLRRRAVEPLLAMRDASTRRDLADPDALEHLRGTITRAPLAASDNKGDSTNPRLHVMVRTMDQLEAVLAWRNELLGMVYCDFEDVRRYRYAVTVAKEMGVPVGLATLRVIKPSEEGLLNIIADAAPDAVLVRNLAAISYYREHCPDLPLLGDYALNIVNELTADLMRREGITRLVPGYDLNWQQLGAMMKRVSPALFELVIHQHMPMFHMEHCVFAHTLSKGKDYRDCGRPCDNHRVDLRDRTGVAHPLVADTGCRNTLYNAQAQSAAEYVPRMLSMGIRHYRVELLRESGAEAVELLDRYARVLRGEEDGRTAWRKLKVLNQLGVTRGTLG